MATRAELAAAWRVPRPVLSRSAALVVALLAPTLAVGLVAGSGAAVAMVLAYVALLTPAARLPLAQSAQVAVLAATAGAVAVALHGEPVAAACFAALVCLLVAPGNLLGAGLLAGVPTVAAVFLAGPIDLDPQAVLLWMLVGGAVVILVLRRVPRSAELPGLPARTAYVHAVVMAVAVGLSVLAVLALDLPHGYWVPMTLTIVLRPFGGETRSVGRSRVLGTVVGSVAAVALSLVLPAWAAVTVGVALTVLVAAYAALGRPAQSTAAATPGVVLLGSLGSPAAALGVTVERLAATVVGAGIATALALALLGREESDVERP